MRPTEPATTTTAKAISTYWLDVVSVGGASVAFFLVLLTVPREHAFYVGALTLPLLNFVFNFPHFMASYRMLYGSRERVRRYRTASLWVPLALAAWGAYGLWRAEDDGTAVHL